jgi:hypothetical protein
MLSPSDILTCTTSHLLIQGSDGADYMFLLKGHEDLRLDERVMQLFGLVNTLLANNRRTSNRFVFVPFQFWMCVCLSLSLSLYLYLYLSQFVVRYTSHWTCDIYPLTKHSFSLLCMYCVCVCVCCVQMTDICELSVIQWPHSHLIQVSLVGYLTAILFTNSSKNIGTFVHRYQWIN